MMYGFFAKTLGKAKSSLTRSFFNLKTVTKNYQSFSTKRIDNEFPLIIPKINLNKFTPKDYTASFHFASDRSIEKPITAYLIASVISAVSSSKPTTTILDIGSFDCQIIFWALMIAYGNNQANRYELYPIDKEEEFIKLAKQEWQNIDPALIAKVNFNPVVGDGLSGSLIDICHIPNNTVDLAVLSNVLYGVSLASYPVLINDLFNQVLAKEGIALCIHGVSKEKTLIDLVSRFRLSDEQNLTDDEETVDIPTKVERALPSGITTLSFSYEVKIYLDYITELEWQALEDINNIDFLQQNQYIRGVLLIATFICQTEPVKMAMRGEGKDWCALIRAIKECVSSNNKSNTFCYFADKMVVQMVVRENSLMAQTLAYKLPAIEQELAKTAMVVEEKAESKIKNDTHQLFDREHATYMYQSVSFFSTDNYFKGLSADNDMKHFHNNRLEESIECVAHRV